MVNTPKKPEKPDWFHPNGSRMELHGFKEAPTAEAFVLIKNEHAEVKIVPCGGIRSLWNVSWTIKHLTSNTSHHSGDSSGTRVMNSLFLHDAFCANAEKDHATIQGGTRSGDFLNFPCQGTGENGDPNISILLNHRIKWAVDRMIRAIDP